MLLRTMILDDLYRELEILGTILLAGEDGLHDSPKTFGVDGYTDCAIQPTPDSSRRGPE